VRPNPFDDFDDLDEPPTRGGTRSGPAGGGRGGPGAAERTGSVYRTGDIHAGGGAPPGSGYSGPPDEQGYGHR
jgi:hypothetical protein